MVDYAIDPNLPLGLPSDGRGTVITTIIHTIGWVMPTVQGIMVTRKGGIEPVITCMAEGIATITGVREGPTSASMTTNDQGFTAANGLMTLPARQEGNGIADPEAR